MITSRASLKLTLYDEFTSLPDSIRKVERALTVRVIFTVTTVILSTWDVCVMWAGGKERYGQKGKKKVYRNAPDREECGLYKPTLWDKLIRIPFVCLPVPFTFSVHSNLCIGLPPRVWQIFQYHKTSLFALKKGSMTTVFACLPFEAEPEDQNCPDNTK